jgi:hypothetical protein
VLDTRKKVTTWFGNHGDNDATGRHAAFNNDLEETLNVLKPYIRPHRPRKAAEAAAESFYMNTESLESDFERINVDEAPTVHATKVDDVGTKEEIMNQDNAEENEDSLPMLPSVQIEKDESELSEEFFFTIQMFLLEIYEIGQEVLNTWMMYVRGHCSLVVASLSTNTAIELVRQAESRFDLFLERPSKYPASKFPAWSLPAVLYYTMHPDMHHHSVETVVLLKASGFTTGDQGCPHGRFCQWPVYSVLKYFLTGMPSRARTREGMSPFPKLPPNKNLMGGEYPMMCFEH